MNRNYFECLLLHYLHKRYSINIMGLNVKKKAVIYFIGLLFFKHSFLQISQNKRNYALFFQEYLYNFGCLKSNYL